MSENSTSRDIRLVVGAPAYKRAGDVDQWICGFRSCLAVSKRPRIDFRGFAKIDTITIDYARDVLIDNARDAGANWLLMYDADTLGLDAEAAMDMVITGHEKGAQIIAAPVVMRRGGYNVVIKAGGPWATWDQLENKVQPVDLIGSGFMAVNVEWLTTKFPDSPWFHTLRPVSRKPQKVGSDLVFSAKVNKVGGLVLCDGRFSPEHVGVGETGHRELDEKVKAQLAASKQNGRPAASAHL